MGERGVKALTHRQVDAKAALPEGSTSNHFRTKLALLQGTVEGILLVEAPLLELAQHVTNREELVEAVTGFVLGVTRGEARLASAARVALFLEARHDECLRAQIAEGRQAHLRLLEVVLTRLGSRLPEAGALALVSVVEGLVLDMLTCAPHETPELAIELVVNGVLPGVGA